MVPPTTWVHVLDTIFEKAMPSAVRLLSLQVRNLGVLRDVTIDIGEGLTVLTGETGAGKTLVVDALELVRGADMRLDSSLMSSFSVIALFSDGHREVTLGRELSDAKRLKATIDGQIASAEAIARAAESLFTIHGQRMATRAGSRLWQREIIDRFGAVDTAELAALRQKRQEFLATLGSSSLDPSSRDREVDLLRFQINEYDELEVTGEAELSTAVKELQEISAIRDATGAITGAAELLSADNGPVESIASILAGLPSSDAIGDVRQSILSAVELLRDAGTALRAMSVDDTYVDERMVQLEARVDELTRFARKHGGNFDGAVRAIERARQRVVEIESSEEAVVRVRQLLAEIAPQLEVVEARVRSDRQRAAQQFAASVTDVLPRVALPHGRLAIAVSGDDGADLEFAYQPHHDAPAGPLVDMASGGELSRVMLALTLVSLADSAVAVFDEVDAGIGGSSAQSIGDCLSALARHQQVIAVTHTASIAAKAQSHWVVEKSVDGASATIRKVIGHEREREIARMLSGNPDSPESLALARQLLG
jgi:DNA repair protein RecN (Recombination protein N)